MRKIIGFLGIAACGIWAADRPAVSGNWVMDAAHAGKVKITALAIRQASDSVQISEASGPEGKSKKVELECGDSGQQCKIKEAGEQVSFWYDGAALVMMEMRHNNDVVIKTMLKPSEDGKTLQMEVVHIAPAGQKDESYTLTRQAGS
jgi:hypothetical protein